MSSEQTPHPAPRPRRRQADAADPGQPKPGEAPSLPVSDSAPLTDSIAMRALAHPVRVALIELLAVIDTLTATQASELLGESPANCAFHLRTLAKYGFVQEAGGGRGRERPWKSAERNITISTQQDDPQAATAAGALSQAWLDIWMARARQVFASDSYLPGWEHATGWSRTGVFLSPEETINLRGQIRGLLEPYEARKSNPALRPPGALPVEWSVFAAPVSELAGFIEQQAREAAEHKADPSTDPDRGPAA
jgi:predicted transcriptional regulator